MYRVYSRGVRRPPEPPLLGASRRGRRYVQTTPKVQEVFEGRAKTTAFVGLFKTPPRQLGCPAIRERGSYDSGFCDVAHPRYQRFHKHLANIRRWLRERRLHILRATYSTN